MTPLIVISPSNSTPSPAGRLAGERDLGVALGVEELGRQRWRVEVLVLDLDARDLRAAPASSPSASDASKSFTAPLKVATPMYLTSKPTLEWTGSA